jgi:hypothetical protein
VGAIGRLSTSGSSGDQAENECRQRDSTERVKYDFWLKICGERSFSTRFGHTSLLCLEGSRSHDK